MSEPEDVLLEAAHYVGTATRALWERQAEPRDAAQRRAARAERRIAAWLAAGFETALPVLAWDAPPTPSWLARALGRPAPWQERPVAAAWTDGERIFLPRARLEGEATEDANQLLLAALAQGLRVARGRASRAPHSAQEADVQFAREAAQGDAELAAAFPGLAPLLDAARAAARASRPPLHRLHPAERAVENDVRALLEGPACDAAERAAAQDAAPPAAGAYRGMAPVAHWGMPAPADRGAFVVAGGSVPLPSSPKRGRSRTLRRQLRRRPAADDDAGSRTGPFMLPHGDPQLAVQDAHGVVRPEDRGEEDIDALADELERMDELPVVRSPGEVREVLDAGGRSARRHGDAGALASPRAHSFSYPEWDFARGAYRDPGIVLREAPVAGSNLAWAARLRQEQAPLLARLRRHFEALRPRRERIGRQLDGDTVDVDGIVADHAERCAGLAPEGRVYGRERPRRRDVTVALLVDASGSTDGWVFRNQRVIDVAKQAAFCLCEALTALGDQHAVYAFSGRGPGDVRVSVAKRFDEPFGATVGGRIGAIEPDRSTRLGGPIRHVTARLARCAARARLLLVLSDGKPDDEDAYEGEYGLEDVRQAVFEARCAGVQPFCVTIDRAGPSYLPRLFGPNGYTVLWNVEQLPARLPALYRRLAATGRSGCAP